MYTYYTCTGDGEPCTRPPYHGDTVTVDVCYTYRQTKIQFGSYCGTDNKPREALSVPSTQSPETPCTRLQTMAPELPAVVDKSLPIINAGNSDGNTVTRHPPTTAPTTEAMTPQPSSAGAASIGHMYIGGFRVGPAGKRARRSVPPLRTANYSISGRALEYSPPLGRVRNDASTEGIQLGTWTRSGRRQVKRGRGGGIRGKGTPRGRSRGMTAARASQSHHLQRDIFSARHLPQ